jgi:hypothetical protein
VLITIIAKRPEMRAAKEGYTKIRKNNKSCSNVYSNKKNMSKRVLLFLKKYLTLCQNMSISLNINP